MSIGIMTHSLRLNTLKGIKWAIAATCDPLFETQTRFTGSFPFDVRSSNTSTMISRCAISICLAPTRVLALDDEKQRIYVRSNEK